MKNGLIALAAVVLLSTAAPVVFADVASVTKYVTEATELVGKGPMFFDDATSKLELAAGAMDDVPADQKPALQAKIDAIKTQIQTAANAGDKLRFERKAKSLITDLEGSVGNLAVWPGKSAELTELLNDPKAVAALGEPSIADYKKQLALMTKVHQGKALKANLATATDQVADLERGWAEQKTKISVADATADDRARAVTTISRDLDQSDRFFKDLPADNADVKALRGRVDAIKTEVAAAGSGAAAADQVERIDRFFDSNKDEFAGMEAETAVPTWAEFKASNSNKAREFNAPKTLAYLQRVTPWLADFEKTEDYIAAKNAPAVKAKIDAIKSTLEASRAKVKKNAEALVAGLEAEKVDAKNVGDASSLHDSLRNALGEDTADGKALIARVTKAEADFKNAGAKADADKTAFYKNLTEQADKAWPAMMAKFDVADGFDPNNAAAMKGKLVKLVGNNLIGWRYKHGDFSYATTVNGVAVAGTYDPAVKAALAEVEAKIGRAIGDSDDDGEWTVIARVEGRTGQLVKMEKQTGDVTVDGRNVGTVESTVDRPVDAPIVTVVAVKAGPVAAAAGQGAVKEDGSVSAPVAVGGSPAAGRRGFSFIGLLTGLLAIVVGGACLLKAKFAPLAGNAGAAQIADKVGSQNLAYLGLAGIALGALGLLINLIALPSAFFHAVIGLVASLAMVVAGGVVARDFFEARGLLPARIGGPLSQFAVPAGLACAALGLLTVLLSLF